MASHTYIHLKSNHNSIYHPPLKQLGIKQTTIDLVGGITCNICRLTYATKQSFDSHYRTHGEIEKIIYTCNICFKEIPGYSNFRGHCYTNHVIKERFQCEHCLKQFSKISNLKEHVDRIHKIKCPTCRKEFPSKKELRLHQIIHNGLESPPYYCKTCKFEIDSAEECKEHVDLHLKFLYSCPICNKDILDKDNAADHMKIHFDNILSGEKNINDDAKLLEDTSQDCSGIMCKFCSIVLQDRVKFDAHFSCKHGDEDIVYMCVECNKSFEKYSIFKNHCYNHAARSRFRCELCTKKFPRLSMLAAHTVACQDARAAGAGRKVFACTVCGRRFASLGRWREHLRLEHEINQRLPCPEDRCHRTFETPKQLILHQQTHKPTTRNFCSKCRLAFTSVASCERHMEMHRTKIYYCPICKRNAKDKKIIIKHIPKHFEVISHLCRICGKHYNSKKLLIEHLKVHRKVKSYSCAHCNKGFSKPSELEQHVNTHTGFKPYKCPICKKSFSNYPNWIKHVRRMHHEESIHIKNPFPRNSESSDEEDSGMDMDIKVETEVESTEIAENTKPSHKSTYENNNSTENIDVEILKSDHNNQANHKQNIKITNKNLQRDSIEDENSAMEATDDEEIEATDIMKEDTINQKLVTDKQISSVDHHTLIDSNMHKCPICENTFANYPSMTQHFRTVHQNTSNETDTQNNNYKESVCNKSSTIQAMVDRIIGTFDDAEKQISNNEIPITDKQISSIDQEKHYESEAHKCPVCEITFSQQSYVAKHVRTAHLKKSIDVNNQVIYHLEGATSNSSAVEAVGDDRKVPSVITKELNTKVPVIDKEILNIEQHANIDSNSHKCPVCDKTFAKSPNMIKHFRAVHQKKNIENKNHVRVKEDNSAIDITVDEESEMSTDTAKYNNYEQDNVTGELVFDKEHNPHIGIKQFKCSLCEKSFAKPNYVSKHIRRVHHKNGIDASNATTDQKDCGGEESSSMETTVEEENHMLTDNLNRYKIEILIKPDKPTNKIEHQTSTVPKPHKCLLCEKSFAKYAYMTKHVRTVHHKKIIDIKNSANHIDGFYEEKPRTEIVGEEENYIFAEVMKDYIDDQVPNIDKQMAQQTQNESKPHKCPQCEKTFAKLPYVTKHVRKVHKRKNDLIQEAMEALLDDNDRSTDNTKDDNDELISKTSEINSHIDSKPFKCPICEKPFAKHCYVSKHVRRVHHKKGTDSKNPYKENTKNSTSNTGIDLKCFDSGPNPISKMDSIINIANNLDSADGLSDIDDANASIDFANVKLETYIFSVQNNGTLDMSNIPSVRDLLNVSNIEKEMFQVSPEGVDTIENNLLYESSVSNVPIERDLFHQNGVALSLDEKDIFNGNSKLGAPIAKFSNGNAEENDILEFIAEMPESNMPFVPVVPQDAQEVSPARFASDFVSELAYEPPGAPALLDIDDHMLPHIDPLLTIQSEPATPNAHAQELSVFHNYNDYVTVEALGGPPARPPPWATPLKLNQYAYYGDLPDARLPIMNTDIF